MPRRPALTVSTSSRPVRAPARPGWSSAEPDCGRCVAETIPIRTRRPVRLDHGQGQEVELTAGTVARVEIEVERQPPITLVVPLTREGLGY